MPETDSIRVGRRSDRRLFRALAAGLLLAFLGAAVTVASADGTGLARLHLRPHARQSRTAGSETLSDDARQALAPVLEASERIERVTAAVGCTLVLTDRRLLVIRDGAKFRPRSGVRWWPLHRDLTLRLARVRHDTSRLVIQRDGRPASVFLTGTQVRDAQALIAEIRHRTFADG